MLNKVKSVIKFVMLTILIISVSNCKTNKVNELDLSGTWQFKIDSLNHGVENKWFNQKFEDTIILPGSMVENGKGEDISVKTHWTGEVHNRAWYIDDKYKKYRKIGNVKIPFWLQPLKKYYGVAWYQKEIIIPENWKNQEISLYLERCHWETKVWIDDHYAGTQNYLGTAHEYELSKYLTPGKHRISIFVDNRVKEINPGPNSHSITDHTQSNWNGIVGDIYLKAKPKIQLLNVQVFPNIKSQKVVVKLSIKNKENLTSDVSLELLAKSLNGTQTHNPKRLIKSFSLKSGNNKVEFDYPMGKDQLLWDEFHPNLYDMEVTLKSVTGEDRQNIQFGMRDFKVNGTQFSINGRPIFLRGTLESAIFPKTGYPAMNIAEWTRICKVIKSHGLNHIRFHSWCPPKAAFIAADRTGVYLQVESSSWANQGASIGDGNPIDLWIYNESEAIVKAYGNHPSFCLMAYGNEPAGKNQAKYLGDFIKHWKAKDLRRVYTSGAGWPLIEESDYHNSPSPRIQGWGQELKSIINSEAPKSNYDWGKKINQYTKPVVSHEIGQWCVYPNFKEIDKYTGVLKAKNFEIFQETLGENHMSDLSEQFLMASGKLQALCYKAEIEAALRTKGFGGFQLLDLHDFPGQGTALVGVLDPFWEEKGYISPEEFSQFCNTTVPLARLEKHIFINSESFIADIEVAHFGKNEIENVTPKWRIIDTQGTQIYEGNLSVTNVQIGNGQSLGRINIGLNKISVPQKLTLEVQLNTYKNTWDFWVYPSTNKISHQEGEIRLVSSLNNETKKFIKNGGKVILSLKKGSLKSEFGGNIGVGFSSIFWNTAWTGGQKPHTLGILCDPKHKALEEFPTEYHSNWQWWDAMSHSNAIILDSFSPELKPIVRVIDDWVTNRRLALVFEVNVGKGKLIVSGIDLLNNQENRPEAKQLLYSLQKYANSNQFNPTTGLTIDEINNIFN
ncbi:sugar-binding domain-containing protein [Wocania ichthyoenteri]|uniref:sugar-binding domain-containing protein n=1 Tax=Wocania ichthyoenteri TaxID=1230531 RepID=UPI00053E682E|nr:sugar-binding domain-containing protein [Wocania ichthyoenteri]